MTYPPAPWTMHGDMWLSLFRVRGVPDRPDGIYGAAWVSYREPSPLTYGELLVARLLKDEPGRPVRVTDIWVDSAPSREGGRALWAIPKDLCDFEREVTRTGPLRRAHWQARAGATPIAAARFTDISRANLLRAPFRGATHQLREDGSPVTAALTGSARALPARAAWDFHPDGPLGWLAGRRSIASFAMTDFAMSFG